MRSILYDELIETLNENGEVHSITILNNKSIGKKFIKSPKEEIPNNDLEFWNPLINELDEEQGTYIKTIDNKEILVEHIMKKPKLIICGGGHIALSLSKIGKMLEFEVTVIDSREEFANEERFKDTDKVLCGDFAEIINKINTDNNTYFVIVTRGHKDDKKCLENIIRKPHKYIGMIGSKSKVISVFKKMLIEGYKKEELESVYTPIGLNINAQTPEEIAISIFAEIIKLKNKRVVSNIEEKIIDKIKNRKGSMILATIIDKRGSTPRGVGARMLICEDGSFLGTVGGGSVENAIYEKARELLKEKRCHVEKYDLSNSKASKLGMACGGTIKVLFEYISLK